MFLLSLEQIMVIILIYIDKILLSMLVILYFSYGDLKQSNITRKKSF